MEIEVFYCRASLNRVGQHSQPLYKEALIARRDFEEAEVDFLQVNAACWIVVLRQTKHARHQHFVSQKEGAVTF